MQGPSKGSFDDEEMPLLRIIAEVMLANKRGEGGILCSLCSEFLQIAVCKLSQEA